MSNRYVMLEKAGGGAVITDRLKVVLAAEGMSGETILKMSDGSDIALKAGIGEVADLLALQIRGPSSSLDGRDMAFNRQHLVCAEEKDGLLKIRFSNGLVTSQAGASIEAFFEALVQMERKGLD